MKIIFMGTPDFAVKTLEAMHDAGYEIVLAVTQPDRPKGRGGKVAMSPVKEAALAYGMEVFQPVKIREDQNIEYLRRYEADVIVVVAFGQILPQAILDLPRICCVNVHGSLLPKYRGASPIQWTVLNGDPVGGVTTMRMDAGLDTGDIIMERQIPLSQDETSGSLFEKVSAEGAKLLIETLRALEDGTAVFTKQEDEKATKTRMITKAMGLIDFDRPAGEIDCLIRGMDPWPSAHTFYKGRLIKIWRAEPLTLQQAAERFGVDASGASPGTIIRVTKKDLFVSARDSMLRVLELQAEGKKRMQTDAFVRGFALKEGDCFEKRR